MRAILSSLFNLVGFIRFLTGELKSPLNAGEETDAARVAVEIVFIKFLRFIQV